MRGPWLEAHSLHELKRKLPLLCKPIPGKGEGQKTPHIEAWTLAHSLKVRPNLFGDQFPQTFWHEDRPDFRIDINGHHVGLEVVEAIPRELAHAYAVSNSETFPDAPDGNQDAQMEPAPMVMDTTFYREGVGNSSRQQIEQRILSSEGSADWFTKDDAEQDWAGCMKRVISGKVRKAQHGHYTGCDRLELLVYDDVGVPSIKYPLALNILAADADFVRSVWSQFNAVYIYSDGDGLRAFYGSFDHA